jgi:hypothetical protein
VSRGNLRASQLCAPHHLSPVEGQGRHSREARHPQQLVTRDCGVQRPRSRQNITLDDFSGRTGIETPSPKPPLMQSRLKTWASGALAGSRSNKNLELLKCVSYSVKAIEVHGHAPRVVGQKELLHLHTHIGRMAAGNPWYGPSWEEA